MDPAQEIELNALARQKPMNDVIDRFDSNVQQFYKDTTIFVTGGSGFIGKQLVEKLFRSCAIKKIYLLIRYKKSISSQERLTKLLRDPVFDCLRMKQPQFYEKIIPVEGDIADIRLGLSDKDWITLTEEVNIIFHAAATVNFEEPLRKATLTNIRGTREALELAKGCKNLIKFVYVSTAFSCATKNHINKDVPENFYPSPVPPQTMISLAECTEERKLADLTKNLIEGWPNTYTFTKCIAEELIRTTEDLPLCIVRPAIVLPAYCEPAPGWLHISTLAGPSGIFLGAGIGVLRVFCADVNSNLAVAPVDYVNNALIAAAWDSTERKKNGETEIPVYTMARDLRYGFIGDVSRKELKTLATPKAIWRSQLIEVKSKWLYVIFAFLLQYVPAYFLDLVSSVTGRKPKEISSFVGLYRKVDKLTEVYNYFTTNAFKFKDENVKNMINRMSDADRAIFNCNLEPIDLRDYVLVWGIGLKKYILKDGLIGTKEAYKKQQMFTVLNYIAIVLYGLILSWIFRSIYLLIKYIILAL